MAKKKPANPTTPPNDKPQPSQRARLATALLEFQRILLHPALDLPACRACVKRLTRLL